MSIIVTDAGFGADELKTAEDQGEHLTLTFDELKAADETALPSSVGLAIANDIDPNAVEPWFDRVSVIVVPFPSFADGRGFSLAKHLRQSGYRGKLRARGHLIADQYGQARRVGFDEVEIAPELAKRQPEDQWLLRADWQSHFYQKRLQADAGTV